MRLPNASAAADAGRTWISGSGRSDEFNSHSYQLRLAQPLYAPAADAAINQAEARLAQTDAELESARQGLILRVSETYFGILTARDTLEFARAEQRAIERQLEQAQERFEVGLVAITDVHEARARYDLVQAQAIAAENQLALAREALRENHRPAARSRGRARLIPRGGQNVLEPAGYGRPAVFGPHIDNFAEEARAPLAADAAAVEVADEHGLRIALQSLFDAPQAWAARGARGAQWYAQHADVAERYVRAIMPHCPDSPPAAPPTPR